MVPKKSDDDTAPEGGDAQADADATAQADAVTAATTDMAADADAQVTAPVDPAAPVGDPYPTPDVPADEPLPWGTAAAKAAQVEADRLAALIGPEGAITGGATPEVGVFVGEGVTMHSTVDGEWEVDPQTGKIVGRLGAPAE